MASHEEFYRRLAQWYERPADVIAEIFERTVAAYKQAMAEFGVPLHVEGECPSLPCPCWATAELRMLRVQELLGLMDEGEK